MRGLEQIPLLYDAGMVLCDALGLSRWRRALVGDLHGQVLEVGCGTGRTLTHYTDGTDVIALDPDPTLLARAARRAPHVPLLVARAEALPFLPARFDVVITSLVFCSVDDVPRGLAEIHRVLKDGGRLRMLEHVRATTPLWARLQDAVQPAWTRLSGGCRPNRAMEEAVEAAGFRIEAHARKAHGVLRCFSAKKR